jgi:transposase
MSYKTTGNPNGRPLSERNKLIMVDVVAGMKPKEISEKYEIKYLYAQKFVSEYKRKQGLKTEKAYESANIGLYADRDHAVIEFLSKATKRQGNKNVQTHME